MNSVQTLHARWAHTALCCGLLFALGCDGDPQSDGGQALPDAGRARVDASANDDGGAHAMQDGGASDGGQEMVDAGPPAPVCPAVDCDSLAETTTTGRLAALDECAFGLHLQRPLAEGEALADALLAHLEAEGLGTRRDLAHVTSHMNREGRAGLSSAASSRLAGLNARGFRWNSGDENVTYWYPQGISGSADAGLEGQSLILVSWYHKTDARPTKGVRLSLADVSDLSNVRYRHLLLVEPTADGEDFGPAEYDSGGALHAGGIAWIGDRIYVADTAQGLRIFDLSRAFAPTNTNDTSRIGVSGGRSDAHGYAYAVPRVGRYVRALDTCRSRFSFVARGDVDGQPALITGAYDADTPNGRLVAWPLDLDTGLLAGGDVTYASAAAIGGQTRIQGALRHGDVWYLSSSSQDGSDGRLYAARGGQESDSVRWVRGAEDLYLDENDRLWTPAEHPGARDVVSIPRP